MLDKITKDFIIKISKELDNQENKRIINEQIIYPLLQTLTDKLYPYGIILFSMYCINIILIIIILILLYKKH